MTIPQHVNRNEKVINSFYYAETKFKISKKILSTSPTFFHQINKNVYVNKLKKDIVMSLLQVRKSE